MREEIFMDILVVEAGRAGHSASNKRHEIVETIFTAMAFAEAGELAYAKEIVASRSGDNHHPPLQCSDDVGCCMRRT